ncbi:MAG TPA: hypothetical protein VGG99_00285 [Acetobacteraceae bacterium]|jgi:adenine-specific DNA-methyltransferase
MTTVFIGGSRRVSRLGEAVRARLDTIVEKRFPVIVGDANGVDKAVQQYLSIKGYEHVEVFCSGTVCRNNVGDWHTRQIKTDPHDKGFRFYAAKDRVMAGEADFGLMIWDGKSTGTLLNVLRLSRQQKKVVVYNVPQQRFVELRAVADWQGFVATLDAELRDEIAQRVRTEERTYDSRDHPALLPMISG